jgi:hypothetical protein
MMGIDGLLVFVSFDAQAAAKVALHPRQKEEEVPGIFPDAI